MEHGDPVRHNPPSRTANADSRQQERTPRRSRNRVGGFVRVARRPYSCPRLNPVHPHSHLRTRWGAANKGIGNDSCRGEMRKYPCPDRDTRPGDHIRTERRRNHDEASRTQVAVQPLETGTMMRPQWNVCRMSLTRVTGTLRRRRDFLCRVLHSMKRRSHYAAHDKHGEQAPHRNVTKSPHGLSGHCGESGLSMSVLFVWFPRSEGPDVLAFSRASAGPTLSKQAARGVRLHFQWCTIVPLHQSTLSPASPIFEGAL